MSIEKWSDNIVIVELQDDPQFSDEMKAVTDEVEANSDLHVILNFKSVNYVNSSNIAKLLKLRKKVTANKHRLVVTDVDTNVWGLFLLTGLEKIFEFSDSVSTALASVQITGQRT